jgi:hypothetical protein
MAATVKDQETDLTRSWARLTLVLLVLLILLPGESIAQSDTLDDLYTTRTIVTGHDERNRPAGFRLCFQDALVKLSGDAGIVNDRQFEAFAAKAGEYVSKFSYRDRLEGKPIHDEQGTYDRPYFLTCEFDHEKIDRVLKSLGRNPWLEQRPRLILFLAVHGRTDSGLLSSDGAFDPDMRESLANAAGRYGLPVNLPSTATLQSNRTRLNTVATTAGDRLLRTAEQSGGNLPLIGDLRWSDAAHGWVATWRLETKSRRYRWSVRGVNYDEAFRIAVRGAARVLSGNGKPL